MFRPLSSRRLTVDIVTASVFGLIALPIEIEVGRAVAFNALSSVLVCVLLAGALAVRRLSPALSLAVAWVGAVVQMGFGRPPSFVDLAIFAVLFATAAYGTTRVFWAGFASAFAGAGVITVYVLAPEGLSAATVLQTLAVLVSSLFGLLLAWTVGALVRTAIRARENRRGQELAQARAATEQERVRIARDMHDVVAHSLTVVIAQADGARYAAKTDPEAATAALGTISTTARAALADVRLLLTQLRHSQGDGPQPTLADLEALYAQVRAAGVDLRVDVDPVPPGEPPASVQLAVFRILQEALTNALRHGDGGPVDVRLSWLADRVDLTVRNAIRVPVRQSPSADAFAADPHLATAETPVRGGHGLIGMRERAQLAGGRLDAGALEGAFVVHTTLPIGAPA